MCWPVIRVSPNSTPERGNRGIAFGSSHAPEQRVGLDDQVPGAEILRRAILRTDAFGLQQLRLNRGNHLARYLVLQRKDVGEFAVVTIGPDVVSGCGIYQLRRDAHAVAALSHAAFQHVANAELARSALHVDRFALIRKRRIARDYEKPAQLRQAGDDVLGNSVREIFLFRIAAHVREWKNRYRWSIGCGPFRCACRRLLRRGLVGQLDSVNTNRPGNVLDGLLSQIVKAEAEFVLHLVVNHTRHHDAAGLGQGLKARRNIHAVAVNVVAIDNDVANVEADAELDSFFRRNVYIAIGHSALDVHRATHGINNAYKFDQHSVARRLHDASAMLGNLWINKFFAMCFELPQRAFFVNAHQPAVAGYVSSKNRRESAVDPLFGHSSPPNVAKT